MWTINLLQARLNTCTHGTASIVVTSAMKATTSRLAKIWGMMILARICPIAVMIQLRRRLPQATNPRQVTVK